jgi:hypothetical protein
MKAKLFGRVAFVTLAAFLCLGIGAASCEQSIAHDVGVDSTTVPRVDANGAPVLGKDGKPIVDTTVTQKPISETPAGAAVGVASAVGNTFLPGSGTVISLVGNALLALAAGVFASRAKNANTDKTNLQKGLDIANVAISATASGLQQAVNVMPIPQAATLVKILDVAHDAMGVAGHLQDLIQPNLDTAGQHAPA